MIRSVTAPGRRTNARQEPSPSSPTKEPQIWRGEAADRFHDLLAKLGPDLATLVASHHAAQDALRQYAGVLADAQTQAGRAEANGEQAVADRDAAARRRNQAAVEVASHLATARVAQLRVVEARAPQAGAVVAFLQLNSDAAMNAYVAAKAELVDADAAPCRDGGEQANQWHLDGDAAGRQRGAYACIRVTADGTAYTQLWWSSTGRASSRSCRTPAAPRPTGGGTPTPGS